MLIQGQFYINRVFIFRLLTYFVVFSLIGLSAYSQTGKVQGVVQNEEERPIEKATISLKGDPQVSSTNAEGQFEILNIQAGTHILIFDCIGFAKKEISVEVKANETVSLNLKMKAHVQELEEVVVTGVRTKNGIGNLEEEVGNVIYSGKKNEVLVLDSLDANKAQNNPRQILGRIPGMNFSETEGAGFPSNGFGLRGLNPTQSIEMNTRQNGYNITSDIYGYNEAYYNPAMEAVQRIEIVRGAASLQFGPQFGGVVNFIMKDAPKEKSFEYTTQQTVGSFNLFNSFHSIAGTKNKWSYYAYGQYKGTDGWRPNSGYKSFTGYGKIAYQASERLKIGLEYSILRNRIQMPGGLTDEAYQADSRQSWRARNWLNSPWNIVTGTIQYKLTDQTSVSFKSTYLNSQRNLVWRNEDGGPGERDTIDPATNQYIPREVQRESFASTTNELRVLSKYSLLGMNNTVAVGLRYFYGSMARRGGGPGSTGSDFDMNLYGGDYEYALNFTTTNLAPFIEALFRPTSKLSITPGFRFEYIASTANGYITDGAVVKTDLSRKRYIPLFGIGTQYKVTRTTNIYANVSQAYRPMDYSALTPIGVTSKIDPNLKDASGYNADLGWRGNVSDILNFDLGVFYMQYDKRIGIVTMIDPVTNLPYTLRTNTGNSVSKGIETYIEINPLHFFTEKSRFGNISLFNSFAYIDARYTSGSVGENGESFVGNQVEYAPNAINRLGLTYSLKKFSITYQWSYVSKSYGDANNTESSPNAIVGVIPSYQVMDISATYKIANYNIKAGINNLTGARYFTKRTDEYPGPGIIPAANQSFYVSLGAKF